MVVSVRQSEIGPEVIEACRRGDREAFRALYEAYKDRVYSVACYALGGDAATAADVTQQVFVKLLTSLSKYRGEAHFSTWLHRLVVNVCLDRRRAARIHAVPTDPAILVQHVAGAGESESLTDVAELSDIPSPVKVSSNGYAYDGPPFDAGSSDILGKVEIKKLIAGEQRLLATIGKGELLGELALFRNAPRSATAIAAEPVTLMVIPANRLDHMVRSNPTLAVALIKDLANRMLRAEDVARDAERRAQEAEQRLRESR